LSIETEIKIHIVDSSEFRRRVAALGGSVLCEKHFEDNLIFDFEDARIRRNYSLIRVRSAGRKCFLTYKGPPEREGLFKTREELETEVGSAAIAREILARLGLKVFFRYQKFREEYGIISRSGAGETVCLSLDETPIGTYAELEGSEKGIKELAEYLGIEESSFLRASYYSLYMEYCRGQGRSPGDMVFSGMGNETRV
jgi:adenylate cyclase, class 2